MHEQASYMPSRQQLESLLCLGVVDRESIMPIGYNNSQESFASGGSQLCLGTYDWGFIYA